MNVSKYFNLLKNTVFCTIPVIISTVLAGTRHKLKAIKIGGEVYIIKSLLINELIACVTNLLNNSTTRSKVQHPDIKGFSDTDRGEEVELIFEMEEDILLSASPADLIWLSALESQIRVYVGKADLNLTVLSNVMAISERQLFRRIKVITGLTPNKYIRAVRLQIAREAIESGKYRTIAEISYAVGFETPAYFSKLFKEYYGKNISELL